MRKKLWNKEVYEKYNDEEVLRADLLHVMRTVVADEFVKFIRDRFPTLQFKTIKEGNLTTVEGNQQVIDMSISFDVSWNRCKEKVIEILEDNYASRM